MENIILELQLELFVKIIKTIKFYQFLIVDDRLEMKLNFDVKNINNQVQQHHLKVILILIIEKQIHHQHQRMIVLIILISKHLNHDIFYFTKNEVFYFRQKSSNESVTTKTDNNVNFKLTSFYFLIIIYNFFHFRAQI